MVKPALPVLEYYVNYDYIVNVLCENKAEPELQCEGKCHLTKELKKAYNGLDLTKNTVPSINMKEYPIALVAHSDSNTRIQTSISKNRVRDTYSNLFHSNYTANFFTPPRV